MTKKNFFNPENHHRRSIRLKNYDYSRSGAYFITICTHKRECLFGKNVNGEMVLNKFGEIVKCYWMEIPERYPNVELDEFVVMPNHFHGIIIIQQNGGFDNENNIVGAIHELPLQQHELPLQQHELPLQQHELSLQQHELSLQQHELPQPQQLPQHFNDDGNIDNNKNYIIQRRNMLIPKIIGRFKMNVAKNINQIRQNSGVRVWQRNYYEHIIRNEIELNRIRNYIINNPVNWESDNNYKS